MWNESKADSQKKKKKKKSKEIFRWKHISAYRLICQKTKLTQVIVVGRNRKDTKSSTIVVSNNASIIQEITI